MNNAIQSGMLAASRHVGKVRSSRICALRPRTRTTIGRGLSSGPFAAVDHSILYKKSMEGQHGNQLSLAELEGAGKDDPPFDPFLEEELEEARLLAMQEQPVNDEAGESAPSSEVANESEDDDADSDSYEDSDDEIEGTIFNNDGSLKRSKSELATLRAGSPAGGMFAVIELAGSQHKVTTDDLLIVNRLKPLDEFRVGSIHTLKDVMLVGSSALTLVGMPYISGAEVDIMVEEITKDAKVIIFKNRRRKHSKRKNGFRRDISMLRILDIRMPPSYQDHEHEERPLPDIENVS